VAILEKGFDPADYIIKRGRDSFLSRIKNSQNIIDFTIDIILGKYDINDLSGKLKASDDLISFISTLSSSIIQEECIKKIAQKLDLKENLLFEEMQKKKEDPVDKRSYWENKRAEEDGGVGKEKILPLKKVEIEALKLMVNGPGSSMDDFLKLGPVYFKFEDTKELYKALKKEIEEAGKNSKKINFPIKISSGDLVNAETKKLYNYILFSELYYGKDEIERACKEILTNLKKIRLSEEIEYVRKKMVEYENAKKDSGEESKEKLDRKYDSLYQRLIKLEQEKQNLGIINI
jgi:DNA primase